MDVTWRPLLFIIYINDLCELLTECRANLYADDTAVYCSNKTYIDLILSPRIDLDNIAQWLRSNKLTLNVKKTKFVIFGSKNNLRHIVNTDLRLNGEVIERVREFKYLGLTLDEH